MLKGGLIVYENSKDRTSNNMYKNSSDGLSNKQRLFVDYYIQLKGNGVQAAIKAGYSPKSARVISAENLAKPNIQAAIYARTAELESKRTADTREILEYLASVMRGEIEDEVVVNVGTGKGFTKPEKVKAKVTAKDRNKAAEMLAKVKGMFITKQELEISGALPVVISDDL